MTSADVVRTQRHRSRHITNLTSLFKTSDLLDTERSSFLGFTHEQHFSPSTQELVEQLSSVIYKSELGDRRVRRYFEHYDTPFFGEGKPKNNT